MLGLKLLLNQQLIFLRLKGRTKCITGRACIAGANRNLVGGTAGFLIVIITILYVAFNSFDMLAAAACFIVAFFHVHDPF